MPVFFPNIIFQIRRCSRPYRVEILRIFLQSVPLSSSLQGSMSFGACRSCLPREKVEDMLGGRKADVDDEKDDKENEEKEEEEAIK